MKAEVPDPAWRPVTLRAPLLTFLVAFPLSLVATFEYLSVLSQNQGGIVFAEQQFSNLTSFTYLYLPTILAVLYSILWAWIDLDAKRLEPYFQMSKSEGASASQSILLQYSFDFVLIPPVKAFSLKYVVYILMTLIFDDSSH